MRPLSRSGKQIKTIFHLLGNNENAMTNSLGWCLAQSPALLDRVGEALGTPSLSTHDTAIRLQAFESGTGVTDLEIYSPNYAAWVIEAKRGFTIPSMDQLTRYASRLAELMDSNAHRGLVVLADSDRNGNWLSQQLPNEIDGIPVRALSWREVQGMAESAQSHARRAEKAMLVQFQTYLGSEATMQDHTSNWVYVVSLNRDTFGGTTTFLEVVNEHRKYFHPIGGSVGGWPIEPPNYMAFRYDGCLQSIHHVEDYDVFTDFGPLFPGQPSEVCEPHFLYHLGPPIRPTTTMRVGARWQATRVWCFIDTLLTSDTLVEAWEASKERERRLHSGTTGGS